MSYYNNDPMSLIPVNFFGDHVCSICNDKYFIITPLYSALDNKCTLISVTKCNCNKEVIYSYAKSNAEWTTTVLSPEYKLIYENKTYFIGIDWSVEAQELP